MILPSVCMKSTCCSQKTRSCCAGCVQGGSTSGYTEKCCNFTSGGKWEPKRGDSNKHQNICLFEYLLPYRSIPQINNASNPIICAGSNSFLCFCSQKITPSQFMPISWFGSKIPLNRYKGNLTETIRREDVTFQVCTYPSKFMFEIWHHHDIVRIISPT